MSIKRQATTELNHDNWDQEEPEDEQEDGTGAFKIASKDILEKRVIKTAKRRSQISGDEVKKSVFSGFSGFNKTQPTSFDFLSNLTNGNKNNITTPTTKLDTPLTFGLSNSKPINLPSSGFFSTSGSSQSNKMSTEISKESPFAGTSALTNSVQSVFKTLESKSDNPFNIQTSSSAFASFVSKTTASTPTSQLGSNIFSTVATSKVTTSPFSTNNTSNNSPFKISSNDNEVSKSNNNVSENAKKENEEGKQKYYSELKSLNVCLSDCIKHHVDKTPLCILTPIFKDYEKHLHEIQSEYEKSKVEFNKESSKPNLASTANKSPFSHHSPKSSIFSPNVTNTLSSGDKPCNFSFGISTNSLTNPITTPSIGSSGIFGSLQGASSTTVTPSNGNAPFSFGVGKPFSFNNNVKQKEEAVKEDPEEDEPPKVEFTPLVEENSVFDKKCKIFVKKDGNFVDKGVGTLYIKKINDSGKHQLLVRANTSLGNVLLNFILSSAIPTQRMGKNNVMIVCIPTPDFEPPPVPVLIRVKTSDEADDLLSMLEKHKG